MTQNETVRCGMPQRDQAKVTEICGFHKPNGDEEATLEPPAFALRPDHVSAVSEANGTTVPVCLDPMSSLSIQPLEGSRSRVRRTRGAMGIQSISA